MAKRVILIVLDSVGVGELPDAAEYGDIGSDTLGNISQSCWWIKVAKYGKYWTWKYNRYKKYK